MTLQELVLHGLGDKEPARLQSLENLWEIAHEPRRVRKLQDTQRLFGHVNIHDARYNSSV
jgi:hypothetical protein